MRSRGTSALLLLLLAASAGCYVRSGVRAETLRVANAPRGVTATLEVRDERGPLQGELLEVRDSALLLLTEDPELVLVPFREIRRAAFAQMPPVVWNSGGPSRTRRRQLTLRSRFPQGLPAELLAQLLDSTGQSEPRRAGQ